MTWIAFCFSLMFSFSKTEYNAVLNTKIK